MLTLHIRLDFDERDDRVPTVRQLREDFGTTLKLAADLTREGATVNIGQEALEHLDRAFPGRVKIAPAPHIPTLELKS